MKKGYTLTIDLIESFCVLQQKLTWPVTVRMLEKWVAYCIYGTMLLKQDQVKPKIISSYLFILKSYYIDHHLSLEAFDTPRIMLIIKRRKRLFLKRKAIYLPITKDILEKIMDYKPIDLDKFNINTAFKVVLAGFLYLGKFTYIDIELKKALFSKTKVIKSDIQFTKGNKYAILRLKQNKMDIKHISIQIILAAMGEKTCPIVALVQLYTLDCQPADVSLF